MIAYLRADPAAVARDAPRSGSLKIARDNLAKASMLMLRGTDARLESSRWRPISTASSRWKLFSPPATAT